MARLKESESKEMNLGFRIPAPGEYVWAVTEGINLYKAEDNTESDGTKKTVMLNIPCEILSVARVKNNKADESEVGSSGQYSIVLVKSDGEVFDRGEDNLCQFLTIAGVMKRLMEKFPGDLDFTDQKFVDTLALALPGKHFQGKHSIRKDNQGRDQMNWERIAEVKKAGDGVAYKKEEESSSESDW